MTIDIPFSSIPFAKALSEAEFPILDTGTLPKLLTKETTSTSDLLPHFLSNPPLSWYFFVLANELGNKKEMHFNAIDHVLSILGIDFIKEKLEQAPKLDESANQNAYLQAVQQSTLHATIISNLQTAQEGKPNLDLKCSALFMNISNWILALLFQETHSHLRSYRHFFPLSQTYIETKLLGMTQRQALKESSLFSSFPTALQHLLQNELPHRNILKFIWRDSWQGMPNEYKTWFSSDPGKLFFTSRLTDSLFEPYYPKKRARYLKVLEQQFHLSSHKTLQCVNQAIIECSNLPSFSPLMPPAQTAILLPYKATFVLPTVEKPPKKTVKKKEPPSLSTPAASSKRPKANSVKPTNRKPKPAKRPEYEAYKVLNYSTALSKNPKHQKTPNNAIKNWVIFMKSTFHFDRVNFILLDKNKKHTRSLISYGCEMNAALKAFKITLDSYPLFDKFIAQPAFLHFDCNKHKKAWSQLPAFIIEDGVSSFLFSSIAIGETAGAFIYVDNKESLWPFEPTLIADYRKTTKALGIALTSLSKGVKK